MPTPQSTETTPGSEFVTFSIPAADINRLRTRLTTLETECAQIRGALGVCVQYGETGSITTVLGASNSPSSNLEIPTGQQRRGRPRKPAENARESSEGTASAMDAVVWALDAHPGGATYTDIREAISGKYGKGSYPPNVIAAQLVRLWKFQKAGADRQVVKGSNPIYYPLSNLPSNVVMGPGSTARRAQKRTGTEG
jgi:hypothetical protein